MPQSTPHSHRLCTAPMMDWSDRHCRFFFRQLSPHAVVYTEMVTTGALIHGDVERHLRFHPAEHPVALQLGGSEPVDLARCATLGLAYGYDEVNLNCGCPSERVQHGAFGACLMAEPQLVADCVKAMQAIEQHLQHVDGVMLGRAAYHDPYVLAAAEAMLSSEPLPSRAQIVQSMFEYASEEVARGTSLRAIARHMLGLYHGQPNARLWRRMLSDAGMLAANRPELLLNAVLAVESAEAEIAAVA